MITRTLVVALLLSSPVFADEAGGKFVAAIASAIEAKNEKREQLTAELKSLESGRINRRLDKTHFVMKTRSGERHFWNSPEAKEKDVNKVKMQLQGLENPDDVIPALPFGTAMKVGQIGRLPEHESEPATKIRGQLVWHGLTHTFYRYRALQVVDESSCLVDWKSTSSSFVGERDPSRSEIFWLHAPTAGMIDGSEIKLASTYKVTGTKQYSTAAGSSRTVFVLEEFDASELIKKAKAASPRPK